MTRRSPKTLNARLKAFREVTKDGYVRLDIFLNNTRRERVFGSGFEMADGKWRIVAAAFGPNPNAAIDAMLKRWEGGAKEKL